MPRLVANMVARNEQPHYLHRVLERLQHQVDKIIFTDDCSEDDTPNIAASYGAEVYQMSEPTFQVHEGRLRQASWEHLENHIEPNDWVLAIDADEELYVTSYSLDQLMEHPNYMVYNIDFYHMWNENQYRIDKAWAPHGSTRMFKYHPHGRFANRALACGSEPDFVQNFVQMGRYYTRTGLKMKHLSYIKDVDKKRKYDRYMALDGGAFHSNAHIISIMDDNPVLADWEW